MKRPLVFLLFLAGITVAHSADQPARVARTISEVNTQSHYKERLVFSGIVDKAINLDYFVLSDGTAELVLAMQNVRHRLKVGDEVTVYGRFVGRSSFSRYR